MAKRAILTLDSAAWLTDTFSAVEAVVEASCQKAKDIRLDCVANLADLHCIDVAYCMGRNDEQWWQATVSEASPDDYKLAKFIGDECERAGLDVRVLTEW